MKKVLTLILALSMVVASLTGCGTKKETDKDYTNTEETTGDTTTEVTPTGESFMLGGIGPLTGGTAIYGIAVKNGATLAINEINAAGGVNGIQLAFNFQDDESDPEKAINAYNTLKDWNMQILMGTVTSTPCIAVAEETNNDQVFQLTPSGSAIECVRYDNAFQVCFSDPNQGIAAAQYIGKNAIATKVAVIYDSSDVYSSGIYEKFAAEVGNQNFKIVSAEAFTADSKTDFTVQLQKAKDAGAQLVFLPIYNAEASLILSQANTVGFKPMFFGCDGLDGILTVENFDVALAENLMLLTPFAADAKDDLTVSFVESYKTSYGETPNQFAADAYDAIYIIKAALEKGGATVDMTAAELCNILKVTMAEISVNGLTGEGMTWSVEGEVNKEPKAIKIVNGVYTAM